MSVATAPISPSSMRHERSKPSYSDTHTLAPLTPASTTQELVSPTGRSHTPGGYVVNFIYAPPYLNSWVSAQRIWVLGTFSDFIPGRALLHFFPAVGPLLIFEIM
jgi:hypothetical protein